MSEIYKAKPKKGFHGKQRQKQYTLDVNQRGFLCSCNNREKDCIRESYNILNKYADILYPIKREEVAKTSEETEDIGDELENELKEIRRVKQRFQVVDSGAKNFLFIKTTYENPVELAHKILSDINDTKNQQARFLLRLVPIETTCKAYINDIVKAFGPLAEKYFKDAPKSFSVVYNHRNNNSVNRDEVIKGIADVVCKIRDDHKVDLKNAEVSIIVEVIKGFALIGVVPDFVKFKKYNLLALCGEESEKNAETAGETMEQTNDEKTGE